MESGHDYQAINNGNGYNRATGAYQFLRLSWAKLRRLPRGLASTARTQDAKAAEWATAILQEHAATSQPCPSSGTSATSQPADSPRWDTVPVPSAGNTLTLREYQARWMSVYADPAAHAVPQHRLRPRTAAQPTNRHSKRARAWSAKATTESPTASHSSSRRTSRGAAMRTGRSRSTQCGTAQRRTTCTRRHRRRGTNSTPRPLAEGYDLRGNGYRPAAAGGATSGKSNHGWGLAIDIQVLVIDSTNPAAVDAAFASDEYTWLVNNGPLYGFLNPGVGQADVTRRQRQRRSRRRPVLLPRTVALGVGRLHEHAGARSANRSSLSPPPSQVDGILIGRATEIRADIAWSVDVVGRVDMGGCAMVLSVWVVVKSATSRSWEVDGQRWRRLSIRAARRSSWLREAHSAR